MDYGIRVAVPLTFEEARAGVETALKDEGFGILTEIDVQQTLASKLKVDFDRYTILGVCNPSLAHRGLRAERELGLLLPCNVILYQTGNQGGDKPANGDDSETTVSIFDPEVGLQLAGNEELAHIAVEAKEKLTRALSVFAENAIGARV